MATQTAVNYGEVEITYDKTDIARNARGNSAPSEGWYKFTVTGAESRVSKNKGSMMFMLRCSITDENGNTRGRPITHFLVLPLVTPENLLKLAGFPEGFKHTAPKTAGLVRSYLEATRPADFPHDLVYDPESRKWYKDGERLSKQQETEEKKKSADKVLAFLVGAWKDPSAVFVGDSFVGKAVYEDGRDELSIKVLRQSLPDGETLVEIK